MIFIGIDLAWSSRNYSGGAVIRDNHLLAYTGTLGDDRALIAFITAHLDEEAGAVVAVDAPLRVPNSTGARLCDRLLSADWRAYDAGALPANRRLLTDRGRNEQVATTNGPIRGEALVAQRGERFGFVETAPLPQRGPARYICEIFPHPAHVSLFHLEKTLKYKAKPGRTPAMRAAEFTRYQQLLATLAEATPSLLGTDSLLAQDVSALRGQALKAYEDTLDAVTCAYTGYYLWYHGPAKTCVYGSVAEGHILTPPLPTAHRLHRG
ncbi:MAG TPA: DUF429 domain-containing protein [Caldilineaceae bacterium]|nr:DUF429 domain-containing protein [Caldilineaceae bacterium]